MASNYAEISAVASWFWPTVAFVFGALVGSFLNVCIYRIPANRSVLNPPRSHCACGQPIAWYDNIPIFSWIILRGRARCCGRPFSVRYAVVELFTALLFLWCWVHLAPESVGKAVCGMLFVSVLICATFIDLDHMIIPDPFTIGAGVVGVILSFAVPALHGHHEELFVIASMRSGVDALQGLLIGSGLVLWIALLAESVLKKEAMGFGDVKFVGAIGAFCGWQGAVFSIFGGAVLGSAWHLTAMLVRKIRPVAEQASADAVPELASEVDDTVSAAAAEIPHGFGAEVPFGPMLAIASLLYFSGLDRWVTAYFTELSAVL